MLRFPCGNYIRLTKNVFKMFFYHKINELYEPQINNLRIEIIINGNYGITLFTFFYLSFRIIVIFFGREWSQR